METEHKNRAMIAMSGGVDSSVAAFLMKERGYDCIGVTMKLFQSEDTAVRCEKSCCSLEDVEDARQVAHRLGMPFYVFNFMDDFREQVIGKFIAAYEEGRTPNPCIDCNRYMKFEKLHRRAEALGYDVVVTGHYARIQRCGERYLLKKAVDAAKDQSYVLYMMTQGQLARSQFPLGEMQKEETRLIARAQSFINAKKPESQDICFVPGGDYARVICHQTGKVYPEGDFVDQSERVLGRHKGIIHYTVGQRKGLGLSLPEPLYVLEKRREDNRVVLGRNDALFASSLDAGDFNWIACEAPRAPLSCKARIRYHQKEAAAVVHTTGPDRVHIEFQDPQRAVSRGQAVVLYDGDLVLGGGTIV